MAQYSCGQVGRLALRQISWGLAVGSLLFPHQRQSYRSAGRAFKAALKVSAFGRQNRGKTADNASAYLACSRYCGDLRVRVYDAGRSALPLCRVTLPQWFADRTLPCFREWGAIR